MTQTWLTQEAADRLRAELAQLEGPGRKEVTAKIEAARAEGDLKENGGYHAARDEQGKMEARIRQLKQMLENAHIGTPPASADGKVGAGMVVTAIIAGDEMKFLIGSREISSGDLDVYSEKSPLGAAVLNQENKLYGNTTFSLASSYWLSEQLKLQGGIASAWRPPSINELYSYGLHGGTATFEVGNSNLIPERNFNSEISAIFTNSKFNVELNVYRNYIQNFIYKLPVKPY